VSDSRAYSEGALLAPSAIGCSSRTIRSLAAFSATWPISWFGKADKLARGIRAGSIWINCYQASDPAVPFGGYKMSGYGRERGKQHVEEHLNVKAVWIKTD
jgi:acyl-CoA reductase-like NAD-dependent aldehyde dehydrogenase